MMRRAPCCVLAMPSRGPWSVRMPVYAHCAAGRTASTMCRPCSPTRAAPAQLAAPAHGRRGTRRAHRPPPLSRLRRCCRASRGGDVWPSVTGATAQPGAGKTAVGQDRATLPAPVRLRGAGGAGASGCAATAGPGVGPTCGGSTELPASVMPYDGGWTRVSRPRGGDGISKGPVPPFPVWCATPRPGPPVPPSGPEALRASWGFRASRGEGGSRHRRCGAPARDAASATGPRGLAWGPRARIAAIVAAPHRGGRAGQRTRAPPATDHAGQHAQPGAIAWLQPSRFAGGTAMAAARAAEGGVAIAGPAGRTRTHPRRRLRHPPNILVIPICGGAAPVRDRRRSRGADAAPRESGPPRARARGGHRGP
jgi:hypothetical protein